MKLYLVLAGMNYYPGPDNLVDVRRTEGEAVEIAKKRVAPDSRDDWSKVMVLDTETLERSIIHSFDNGIYGT